MTAHDDAVALVAARQEQEKGRRDREMEAFSRQLARKKADKLEVARTSLRQLTETFLAKMERENYPDARTHTVRCYRTATEQYGLFGRKTRQIKVPTTRTTVICRISPWGDSLDYDTVWWIDLEGQIYYTEIEWGLCETGPTSEPSSYDHLIKMLEDAIAGKL